jgi:hypothetical protein
MVMRGNRFEQLLQAAQCRLEHWGARPDDKIVIMADTGTFPPLLEACHAAAVALGADTSVVMYSGRRRPFLDIPRLAEEAILQSDFFLSIMAGRWSYSSSMARVLGDPRYRSIRSGSWDGDADSIHHFVELLPNDQVIERTERAHELIDSASVLEVKSDLGTDIALERGDPEKIIAYAPAGQVAIAAPPESVNGTMMFVGAHRSRSPGPEVGHRRMMQWPVRIEFEKGYITEIARDNPDGEFLDDWFRRWDDAEVYRFSHINLGLDHRVRLEVLDNLAVHFNYGGLLFGIGAMNTPLFGHDEVFRAKAHIELQLTGADLFLDGRQIMRGGDFLADTGLRHSGE